MESTKERVRTLEIRCGCTNVMKDALGEVNDKVKDTKFVDYG